MKRKSDPRHKAREQAVKILFENTFRPDSEFKNGSLAKEVAKKREAIDNIIKKSAPAWPLKQTSPIDISILRLAIFELIFKKGKVPYKVIVDEAVELAKEYGGKSSPSFVNGVLGSIIKLQEKK
jgi:transcription antitermination protein NusB